MRSSIEIEKAGIKLHVCYGELQIKGIFYYSSLIILGDFVYVVNRNHHC
uniref:Uncharacterized protein n=1 Tax=Triticum urartu TaxID=4572 RepID=A0A8R7K1R2_TRIUA